MTEEQEQILSVAWFRSNFPSVLIYHIPNGGNRSTLEGARFKRAGVVAGIPDLHIPEWNMYIEMKTLTGKLSISQLEVIRRLEEVGCTVKVCKGFEEFKLAVATHWNNRRKS